MILLLHFLHAAIVNISVDIVIVDNSLGYCWLYYYQYCCCCSEYMQSRMIAFMCTIYVEKSFTLPHTPSGRHT